ncbi:MAG: oligosaccharide flippase family protein [Bacteroidales bacterium]
MATKIKQLIATQFDGSPLFDLLRKKRSKQVMSLYTAMILSIAAGIGVSVVNTRYLTPEVYGELKFLQTLFAFVVAFFTLGFFYSGTRLIAQKSNEHIKQNLIGATVFVGGIMSVLFIFFNFLFSWPQEFLFENQLGLTIRIIAPLLVVYPFELFCENMLLGDNRIYTLSVFRLGPKITYLVAMLIWVKFGSLTLLSAIGLYLVSMLAFILFIVYRMRPRFNNLKKYRNILSEENKIYGFPLFTGSLAGLASAQLGGIAISYFVDNTNVGFFSLAVTATMPLTLIPSTVGNTFFKEFANTRRIPRKVTYATIALSILAFILFILFIKQLVILLYSDVYLPVVPLAYGCAVGSFLQGFGDYYNRFLMAHGRGRELRNSSIVIGIANILGYCGMVFWLGTFGAVITKILAGAIYIILMLFAYNRSQHD